jgi:hypothetical protein
MNNQKDCRFITYGDINGCYLEDSSTKSFDHRVLANQYPIYYKGKLLGIHYDYPNNPNLSNNLDHVTKRMKAWDEQSAQI